MAKPISLREFGRILGISGEAVRKAVDTGRIPAAAVGEISLSSGRKRPAIINVQLAQTAFVRNTDQNQVRTAAQINNGKREAQASRGQQASQKQDRERIAPVATAAPAADTGSRAPSINESKQITEAYKARMAKLEYEEKLGKLVEIGKAKALMAPKIVAARNRLMGVPSEAKTLMPHLTVRDIEKLEELIANALNEVSLGS